MRFSSAVVMTRTAANAQHDELTLSEKGKKSQLRVDDINSVNFRSNRFIETRQELNDEEPLHVELNQT